MEAEGRNFLDFKNNQQSAFLNIRPITTHYTQVSPIVTSRLSETTS